MNAPVAEAPRSGPFIRGWVVLTGVFLIMTITSGFAFYSQGVFLKALVDEQGFSTGMAGAGTGVFFGASGLCGYYTGGLINRFDVRWVITVGTVIGAGGLALLGQVRNEWQLFAVMIIFGAGFGLTGLVPTTTVVTRWFQARRSVALAIASTGLSLGGALIAPQIGRLINNDSLVRWALPFAVVFFVTVLLSTWLLVVATPQAVGLRPDGAAPIDGSNGAVPPPPIGTPFNEAIRSRFFVMTSIGFVLVMGSQVGAIQHVYKLTSDRLGIVAAGGALSVLAVTSIVARLCGGLAAVKVPLRYLASFLIVVQVCGLCVLAVADSGLEILIGILVLGSAMGNLLMLHPLILADAFGVRDYSRIYGLGSLLMITGVGTGPFLVGILHDIYDYRRGFFVIAVLALIGLTVYSFGGKPARDYMHAPPPLPRPKLAATEARPDASGEAPRPVVAVRSPALASGRGGRANRRRSVVVASSLNGDAEEFELIHLRTAPDVWSVEPV